MSTGVYGIASFYVVQWQGNHRNREASSLMPGSDINSFRLQIKCHASNG
jgi:hypothetical protein